VIRSAPVAALALLLTACGGRATPSELPGVRLDYNEALVRSSSQQMLLNMVRLRYLHAPQFFEVAAVTTQSRVTRGGGISLGGNAGQNGTQTAGNPVFTPFFSSGISGSVEISETPTVSYAPLQGEEFANRFITPITGRSMIRLVQTGWRIDRVLSCCVTRINRVAAPVISSHAEGYGGEAFQRLSSLLYDLQMAGALEADVYRRGDEAAVSLSLTPREGEPYFEQAQEVRELLDLDPRLSTYEIVETLPHRMTSGGEAPADPSASTATPPGGGDSIVLRGRSLLGTLLYLSHGVEIAVGDTSARDLGYNGPRRRARRGREPRARVAAPGAAHGDPARGRLHRRSVRGGLVLHRRRGPGVEAVLPAHRGALQLAEQRGRQRRAALHPARGRLTLRTARRGDR
jgi:hypothetical protein